MASAAKYLTKVPYSRLGWRLNDLVVFSLHISYASRSNLG